MKRFSLLTVLTIATLLSSCGEGGRYDKIAPRGVFLYPIVNSTSMRTIALPRDLCMHLDIMHHNDEYRQWRDGNDIEEYLENQWEEYLGRPFEPEEAASYLYGQLTNITIISDCKINGKAVGENLADLFLVGVGGPMFIFPEGAFEYVEPKEISFEEFISGNYFCPSTLHIRLNTNHIEDEKTPTFTIALTLSDGTNEKTLTSGCTLEL